MAERAALQEESLPARLLLVQFLGCWRGGCGLALRRQICRSSTVKNRRSKDSNRDRSYFQERVPLALQLSHIIYAEHGPTFCTSTPVSCQEIRYATSFGNSPSFANRCEWTCHRFIGTFIRFSTKYIRTVAVYLNAGEPKKVEERGSSSAHSYNQAFLLLPL